MPNLVELLATADALKHLGTAAQRAMRPFDDLFAIAAEGAAHRDRIEAPFRAVKPSWQVDPWCVDLGMGALLELPPVSTDPAPVRLGPLDLTDTEGDDG